MPVEVTRSRDGHFIEVKCYGKLTVADVSESLDTAFGTRIFEPGLDRIVIIDPRAELHELDFQALQRIRRLVLEKEAQGNREVSFRSVLVYALPEHRSVLELYRAVWDLLDLPGVEFFITESKDEALSIIKPMADTTRRAIG